MDDLVILMTFPLPIGVSVRVYCYFLAGGAANALDAIAIAATAERTVVRILACMGENLR